MTDTLLQPGVEATPAETEHESTGRASGLALPAFAAVVGLLIGSRPLDDNSFLTHLATGRLILDHGFPHSDPYTFTASGRSWAVQSWFASVLYAVADKVGDLGAVRILTAVLTAAVSLVCWRLTARASSPVARLLVWAPAVAVGTGFWVERPLLIGLLLLGLVLVATESAAPFDRRWLLLVGWVWLNTHGSWPLGLVALAVIGLGRRFDGDRDGVAAVVATGKWLVGGLLLGSINPYGPRLLAFPVELLSKRDSLKLITEWQAPHFDEPSQWAFLVLLVLALVGLKRRPSWATALPLAVFTAAALTGARNIPVAAMVLLPGLARSYEGLGRFSGRLVGRQERIVGLAAAGLGAVALIGIGTSAAFDDAGYPFDATRYLESAGLAPNEVRVVSEGTTGNFFEAVYGAGAGAFIDDRIEVLPRSVIDDYLVLLRGGAGWEAVLDEYDADAVLWAADGRLSSLLASAPGWEQRYEDDQFVVFVRVHPVGSDLTSGD